MSPDFYSAVFHWVGVIVVGLVGVALLAMTAILGIIAWVRLVPFVHVGKPLNAVELVTRHRAEIVTLKDGGRRDPSGDGRPIQVLGIRWWFGASSPRRARWFFGFIRWEEECDPKQSVAK